MDIIALLLVGVGLAADAFAAALTQGVNMRHFSYRVALLIAVVFGAFQGLMPVLGWALASQFSQVLAPIDHWIAFALLALIGAHMIREAFVAEEDDASGEEAAINLKTILLLGIGTSIDAAAIGVSFAMLAVNIVEAAAIIALVTFALSFVAVIIGHRVGARFRTPAAVAGGLVLIALGAKILIEHLTT
ncbi:manganese efflux pump MntP family protein [Dermabacter hominis]|uniref:manganese efflux pump MntP n=1 Tax=Dermabacter hominis TaxID=36740 RepID=UPI002430E8D2|nr:manganese efflux pump MntP family protein [Dermabacter hominis]